MLYYSNYSYSYKYRGVILQEDLVKHLIFKLIYTCQI